MSRPRRRGRVHTAGGVLAVAALVVALLPTSEASADFHAKPRPPKPTEFVVEVLSSPADQISGGEARISIEVPSGSRSGASA